jgi:uncharacterized protein (UPF0332 family)
MVSPQSAFLEKAHESLLGAEAEFAAGRYNNAANRAYYACFQAAVVALSRAGIRPPRADRYWSHAFVQSTFTGQLINRRKLYPADLRQVLADTYALREAADYDEGSHVIPLKVERALRRARAFVQAIGAQGDEPR